MKHYSVLSCVTFLLLSCARAPSLPPTEKTSIESCRGQAFDFEDRDVRCVIPYGDFVAPPAQSLAIRTVPSPVVIRSGEERDLTLELRNVSGAPLVVDLDDSCLAFEAVATNATATSFESECGGLCGTPTQKLRVTLEPNGVIRKNVRFAAVIRKVTGDRCENKVHGPLPPGEYRLEVTLPWSDAERGPRKFEGALRVVPQPL